MGIILKKMFDVVMEKKGFKGRLRLTVMTGIPSVRAFDIPDDGDMVARFKRAATEILGEDIDPILNQTDERR